MRNKDKHKGLSKLYYKIIYSLDGLVYGYISEKSFLIHAVISILIISLGFILKISLIEWMLLLVCLFLILSVELLNTALEVTIDMITLKQDKRAKAAKDLGSAATFIASLITFIVFCIVFVPKILLYFK